jgi:hypothetical protein
MIRRCDTSCSFVRSRPLQECYRCPDRAPSHPIPGTRPFAVPVPLHLKPESRLFHSGYFETLGTPWDAATPSPPLDALTDPRQVWDGSGTTLGRHLGRPKNRQNPSVNTGLGRWDALKPPPLRAQHLSPLPASFVNLGPSASPGSPTYLSRLVTRRPCDWFYPLSFSLQPFPHHALVTGVSRSCHAFVTGQKSLKFPSKYGIVTVSRVKSPPLARTLLSRPLDPHPPSIPAFLVPRFAYPLVTACHALSHAARVTVKSLILACVSPLVTAPSPSETRRSLGKHVLVTVSPLM